MHNISISNKFNINIKCWHGMNIFDHLSRKSSFRMHFPTCIFTHINKYVQWNWKLRLYYLLVSACKYFAHWIYLLFWIHHSYYTYFFLCMIFLWLIHFFKYACIFSNAGSCVLVCYICFLHTPFILHMNFFACMKLSWFIIFFKNMHGYFQMAEVVF